MLLMILFILVSLLALFSFAGARRFVREKLRFVDAAQKASTPFIAGIGAFVLGAIVTAFLPVVGAGTALAFALAIGTGVAAGARDIRTGRHLLDDGR